MGWKTVKKWKELPHNCGVYVIYCKGSLVYVGSSKNMQRRFEKTGSGSRYPDITFIYGVENLTYKYKITLAYLSLEKSLIHRLQPKFNVMGTGKLPKRKIINAKGHRVDHSKNWYF